MTPITATRIIEAPSEVVFQTIANANRFAEALPHVVKVEFLADVRSGTGTRFRETRLMNGKEMATELEVTEFVENERIRMVADSHGTIWDTVFAVRAENGRTELTMTMDARTNRLLGRFVNFMIKGMIQKAVERDMDLVKAFCER